MSNFITNSKTKKLKKRLLELLSKSRDLKFLVGFFYFSGLRELYEGIRENPRAIIKVLVGLNVDKTIYGLYEHGSEGKNLSDEERVYQFFKSIKTSINSEHFDNKDFYEQVRLFLELIKTDRLIIRKTYEPNHAKLYIFKLEEEQIGRNALFITGSSNLTTSGLTRQHEFNVEISDYGLDDAEGYFDRLWDRGVFITEHDDTKKRLIELLEKETLIKEITPFEAYALVLKTYLDTFRGKEIRKILYEVFEQHGYKTYNYQMDAVKQALSIIDQNNGVIIADVVGLGKTVIACAIGFELRKRGIVIAPPGIIGDKGKKSGWLRYLEEFNLASLGWEAYSVGDLEKASAALSKADDIEVVIIDEAHRFRNQDTKDYEYLKNICRGRTVMLLTATPFNNRPADIFSLLKLFITPKKSSITLGDDLEAKFTAFKSMYNRLSYIKRYSSSSDHKKRNRAENYYESLFGKGAIDLNNIDILSHKLAREIKGVIEPVTIRRNRLDLQGNPLYKDEIKDLSQVEDPKEWFFELTEEQSVFYDTIINEYFALPEKGGRFKGAIYRPFIYEIGELDELSEEENFQYQQQFNLYDFMRRLLVKRFESSFGAFKESLNNFKRITGIVLEFIDNTKRYILDRNLLEKIYDKDSEEIEECLRDYAERIRKNEYPKNHKIYEIDRFKEKEKFTDDIKADLALFDEILDELIRLDLIKNDPKRECLIPDVRRVITAVPRDGEPKRKVIIFSEYIDTVKYLAPTLNKEFNNRVLVVAGNLTAGRIRDIYRNFDASYEEEHDEFDILLTTDKISEGFNLNRAGMVINYDIPWNPVRVIQRVGRINRISKKVFKSLYIVNFFPTEKGADLVRSREIASNKMFLIHSALGEDAKIFDSGEMPSPSGLYTRIQQNPDYMEAESFYTKVFKAYEAIRKKEPQLIESLKDFPPRVKVAKKGDEDELFVVIKKGRLFVHHRRYADNDKSHTIKSLEDVYDGIAAEKNEPPLSLSPAFWDIYEDIKNLKDTIRTRTAEQSIKQKAVNLLKGLLTQNTLNELIPHKDFIRTLLEDILDYGTLSDYTLRRIANIDVNQSDNMLSEIKSLKKELGEDYLYKEKSRLKELTKEIIIAIENRNNL